MRCILSDISGQFDTNKPVCGSELWISLGRGLLHMYDWVLKLDRRFYHKTAEFGGGRIELMALILFSSLR